MKYNLQDLIDIPFLQKLMDSLHEVHHFPSAIIDNNGKVLVATDWQDACTKFHRINPDSERECIKSDLYIKSHISKAKPAVTYKCPHGLIDNAIPIIIKGVHCANFFTGQFFLSPPNLEFYKKRAKKYGFNEIEYIKAIKQVPVWNQELLDNFISVIKNLTDMVVLMATKKIDKIESEKKQKKAEFKYRHLFENMTQGAFYQAADGTLIDVNDAALKILGVTRNQFLGKTSYDKQWKVVDENKNTLKPEKHPSMVAIKTGKPVKNKLVGVYVPKEKKYHWMIINVQPLFNQSEENLYAVFATLHDVTERKEAEDKTFEINEKFCDIFESVSDGISYTSLSGKVLSVNKPLASMLDVSTEDLIGKSVFSLARRFLNKKNLSATIPLLKAIIQGKNIPPFEVQYHNKILLIEAKTNRNSKKITGVIRDITKQKKFEHEQFKLINIIENSKNEIYVFDTENLNFEYVNSGALKNTGYTLPEIKKITPVDLKPEFSYASFKKMVQPLLEGKKEFLAFETIHQRKNKSFYYVDVYLHTQIVGNKKVFVAIINDISEQILARKEIQKSNELFRFVTEKMTDVVWLMDLNGKSIFVSPSIEQFTGFTVREYLNQKINERFTPESAQIAINLFETELQKYAKNSKKLRNYSRTLQLEYLCKDNTTKWGELIITPYIDKQGTFVGIHGVTRNITDRIAANNKLAESELRFRKLYEDAADPILLMKNGLFTDCNRAALGTLLAKDKTKIIGHSPVDISPKTQPDGRLSELAAQQFIDNAFQEGFCRFEWLCLKFDKTPILLEVTLMPIIIHSEQHLYVSWRDITETKKTYTDLIESEEMFSLAFETSPYAITITTINDGKMIAVNEGFVKMSGYSKEESVGKTTSELNIWKNITDRDFVVSELFKKGKVDSREFFFIKKNKEQIIGNISSRIINIKGKKAILSSIEDVTARRITEAKLKESEQNFREIFNSTNEAIFIEDAATGKMIDCNKCAVEMYSYESKAELLRSSISDISAGSPNYDEENIQQKLQETLQFGYITFEWLAKKKSGEHFWTEVSLKSIIIGNKNRILKVVRDISERKRISDTLQKSEEKYRMLADNSADVIFTLNTNLEYTYLSPSIEKLRGYKPEELIGKSLSGAISQASMSNILSAFKEELLKEQDPKSDPNRNRVFDLEMFRKDGSTVFTEVKVSLLRDADNKVSGILGITRDITEQKQAQHALKESSEKWITTFNSITDIVTVISKDHIFLEINKAGCDALGMSREDIVGKKCYSLVHNTNHPISMCLCVDTLSSKEFSTSEIYENGQYYLLSAWPILNEKGEVYAFSHSVKDITENKKAEIETKKNVERLNSIVSILQHKDANTQVFLDFALEEAIKLTNSKIGYIYFYDEEKKLFELNSWSKDVMDECQVVNPQTCYELDKTGLWGEAVRQSKPIIVNDFKSDNPLKKGYPEGHVNLSRLITLPVFSNDKIVAVIGMANKETDYNDTDVLQLKLLMDVVWKTSKHKIAEDLLAKSENRYRSLFNEMLEGFALHEIICNDKGKPVDYRFITVNPAFEKLTGLKAGEILNRTVREVLPDIEPLWIDRYGKVALTGKPVSFDSYSSDFKKHFFVVAFSPKKNQFATIISDISLQKEYELNLISAKEKAEESDKLKSAFLSNMSHEIRTPLNAIMGFSDLLTMPDISSEDSKEFSEIIKNRSEDLLQIINDIIDVSKIESNQMPIIESEGSISELLGDLFTFFSNRNQHLDQKPIELIMDNKIENKFDKVFSDFSKIKQILINLIGNAYKFTKEGSITYGCSFDKPGFLKFFVSDTGIGIPEDKHALIFERFRQVNENHTSNEFGGNGLGLAISKGLVELLKGKIWVESDSEKGSSFFFTIPYKTTETPVKNNKPLVLIQNFENCSILLVEDDIYNAEYVNEVFRKVNVKITTAINGKETLSLIENGSHFDIVLLDIKLPDISGLELIEPIRKKFPDVKIIAQTAFASQSDEDMCIRAGCDYYISKPIVKTKLFDLIGKCLQKR